MIESLEAIDRSIVLAINGCHSSFLDAFMWIVSGKLTWVPLYLMLIYLGFKKLPRKTFFIYFSCVVASVLLADFISAQLIKDSIMRYRPSHNLLLVGKLHLHEFKDGQYYKGGQYGFVSSHAANFFALAIASGMVLKTYFRYILIILLIIAILVSYSRIYLGVHYLSDIIGGAVVGTIVSFLLYKFVYLKFSKE